MVTLIDSYSESNYSSDGDLSNYLEEDGKGQSFQNVNEITLDSCKFYIRRTGTLTGTLIAKLYSHKGTYPGSSLPNSLLASSTSIDASTISTSYSLVIFSFTGAERITLSASTYYVITLECSDITSTTQEILFGRDNITLGHGGAAVSEVSGTWYNNEEDYDNIFYVYGDSGAPSGTTNQWLNVDDTWRQLSEAWVNVDDSWRKVKEAWINVDDVWRKLYSI